MTVRLLTEWNDPDNGRKYRVNNLLTKDANTEAGLVAQKIADTTLTGGTAYVEPAANPSWEPVTATRNSRDTVDFDVAGRSVYVPSAISQLRALIFDLGGSLWVPGKLCFVDSAGTTPAVSGDPIGLMKDLCGNWDASQATTGNKPLLGADADGKQVLTFDGTDDFLRTSINTPVAGYLAGAWKLGATGAIRTMVGSSNGDAIAGLRFISFSDQSLLLRRTNGTTGTSATCTGANTTEKMVVDGHYDATTSTVRRNGASEGTSSTAITATSTNYLRIGAVGAGADTQAQYWIGNMLAQVWIPGARPGVALEAKIRELLAEIAAVTGVV